MENKGTLTINADKKMLDLTISSILYVIMDGNNAFIHMLHGEVYQTRMTMLEIEPILGEGFIKVKRGCLVSIMAIHTITDRVNLVNGERLELAARHKSELIEQFREKQKKMISNFNESVSLSTPEEYHDYYSLFDSLPIAFCDIEMILEDDDRAVDWIFRYGNSALADLEKVPLEKLIGNTFGSIFPNMDSKWLRAYERSALFGETINIIDYSPEIDVYLDIICFPTFKGHCGCILFDITKIRSYRQATDAERAMTAFISKMMNTKLM